MVHLVVVTSPATDAGKTFLAAGIAEAAAFRGLKTLFVEMDMTVGDAARVFGLAEAAHSPHPTVATWREYPNLLTACLKTPSGVRVLPRPEITSETVSEEDAESLLFAAKNRFDLIVADLGVDCCMECWAAMVRRADAAFLVSDCDEKALARMQRFLSSYCPANPPEKWILAVNAREKKGAYRPDDVARFLTDTREIARVIRIPHFSGVEKRAVKTFPPDSRFAEEALGGVLKRAPLPKTKSRKGRKLRLSFGFFGKLLKKKSAASGNPGVGAPPFAEMPFAEAPANEESSGPPEPDAPSIPPEWGAELDAGLPGDEQPSAERANPDTMPPVGKGTLLLLGPRSSSLAEEMAAQGWVVAHDPSTPADVAVVDANLLPSVKLNCPCVGFSGKISNWYQSGAGDTLIVTHKSLIPTLIAPYARRSAGFLVSAPDQIQELQTKPARIEEDIPPKKGGGIVYAFYSGAQGSQGKTVIAINAGVLLTRERKKVCVVDLDTDKAGLTFLLGYSEMNPPRADVGGCVEKYSIETVKGPAGTNILPAPVFTKKPGWFPNLDQVRWLISTLADKYDYVLLDFGAKLASPPVFEALRMSDQIFIISTPMRMALSAISRFRGRELTAIGNGKITAIINRVGVRGGLAPRDAAALLGFRDYCEVPEDLAVAEAENDAIGNRAYHPPVLRKKNLIGPALLNILQQERR